MEKLGQLHFYTLIIAEKDIKEKVLFTNAPKIIKYIGINVN